MDEWVKIPSDWILDKETPALREFIWREPDKANFTAALMIYIAIAHHVVRTSPDNQQLVGRARLSYTKLSQISGLSRAKIAEAIRILTDKGRIEKITDQKVNVYTLTGYDKKSGWAKLPARHLYDEKLDIIKPFKGFTLRQKNELHALKLYLLLIALRDNRNNHATPSYDKIRLYTGIAKNDIRSAISLLINHGMIHVHRLGDPKEEGKVRNLYRIIGIENQRHTGNISLERLLKNSQPELKVDDLL